MECAGFDSELASTTSGRETADAINNNCRDGRTEGAKGTYG